MATVGGMVLFSLVVRNGATQELLDTQIWYWTFTKNLYVAWNGWSRGWHVLDHFWSLAIEEQFYLVWPWLVLLLDLRWLMRAALIGAAISIALRFYHPVYPFSYVFTPSRADGLLLGAYLALALRYDPGWLRRSAWPLIICGLLLVGLGAWLDGSMSFYGVNMVRYGYMGYSFLFAGWLARTVSGSHSPQEERLLTGRSLCSIGKYSYGIYVFHHIFYWFLLVGMERVGPLVGDWKERVTLICLLLLLPFTYFAARFSYEHFEKRFLLLKPRFAATAD
jgi:peptidoglycan/LPS O-acetylase OafA/YrhL